MAESFTTAGAGPLAYHDVALIFTPADSMVSFLFDGAAIDRWSGLADLLPDAVHWGNAAGGTQRGIMNFHDVVFQITESPPALPGDYNYDSLVDYDDYLHWRERFNSADPSADGNSDGLVNAADYTLWRDRYVETLLPGDYNRDGQVTAADYDVWKSEFGGTLSAADGNGNGLVDAADYTVWRDHWKFDSVSQTLLVVPEPNGAVAVLLLLATTRRRVHIKILCPHAAPDGFASFARKMALAELAFSRQKRTSAQTGGRADRPEQFAAN